MRATCKYRRISHLLLLSLITLFAGPLLFLWANSLHPVAKTAERLVVAGLIGLLLVLMTPEVLDPLGLWAPALMLAGYLLPGLLEKLVKRAAETLHLLSLYVALTGLLLHAVLDGAGLASSELRASGTLALAIILHRFGMGLTLWLIIEPAFGKRMGWLTLFAMAAATILGFEFSERLLPLAGESFIVALQALIIGTIFHGLVHRGHVHRSSHG
jgi:hypothetical protein